MNAPDTISHSPAAQALLEARAKESARRNFRIPAVSDKSSGALSSVQQMVWLSAQLDRTSGVYNLCSALRIVGHLDIDALQRAITEIARRHPILRSHIQIVDGAPQLRAVEIDRIALPVTHLATAADENDPGSVRELVDAEARRPFDLQTGPLMRAGLIVESDRESTLYISTHHIASDGWSDGVMFRELHALYGSFAAGEPSSLPEITTRYSDFVAWQRARIEGTEGKRNAEYWRALMEGAPPRQDLPADRPRPDLPNMSGGEVILPIDAELASSLGSIARSEGATAAMTMLAAFVLMQSRITGQSDTVVGLSLAGRTHPDVENLIGLFTLVLPVRVKVEGEMTFRELLRKIRIASLEAHEHQEVSIDAILETLPSAQQVRHAEIAQTVFNFRNMPSFEPSLPGLDVQTIETFNGTSVAELDLEVREGTSGWECALRFRFDLYDEQTAARLLGHYRTLLQSIAANSDEKCRRLCMLTESERRQLLIDFRGPVRRFPPVFLIHELISEQVRRTPGHQAVSADAGRLTYAELDAESNALAHALISRGVEPGHFVGIAMERSLEMMVTLLATLKTGAAVVPLDLDYPIKRLAHMLDDTKPRILLADSAGASLLGSRGIDTLTVDLALIASLPVRVESPVVDHADDAVACVLYTSGSTGLPKGVLSTHRGIVNNLRAMQEMYRLGEDDCILQQTSLGFDAAAWEIFWPLSVGARVHLARPGGQRDAEYVIDIIEKQRIATVGFAPSMLKVMLGMPGFTQNRNIKRVMSWGEVLSPQLHDALFTRMPHAELYNLYGPSETSIAITIWRCERGSTRRTIPVGRPVANAEIYILDPELEPVPIGVGGEVYIGGICVSNGYHDRPELTAERFPAHPFRRESGERVYRTGDIARFDAGGVIEYIGRRDHQLKIRGVRVELEEIEAALESLPHVSESVVVARKDSEGEYHLVAYIAAGGGVSPPLDMRRALEKRLPPQFLPSKIIALDELPHSPNGKVDRTRLPESAEYSSSMPQVSKAPRTDFEKLLAKIWMDLLNVPHVGINDSFFDLGGHSLLAVRMLQRLVEATGDSVSLRSFYADPTIQAIGRIVANEAPVSATDELPPLFRVQESTDGSPALFYLNGQPAGGGKYARRFAPYLPAGQGLYLVPIPILEAPFRVEDLAARMVTLIRAEQPVGPYLLGGNCFGATLALEIAQQVTSAGEEVSLLTLFHPDAREPMHIGFRAMRRIALLGGLDEKFHFAEFSGAADYAMRTLREIWNHQKASTKQERRERLAATGSWMTGFVKKHARRPVETWAKLRSRMAREADELIQNENRSDYECMTEIDPKADHRARAEIAAHAQHMSDAWTAYTPKPYHGRVAIIWPVQGPANPPWRPTALWSELTPRIDWHFVPGNHWSMLHEYFDQAARAFGDAVASRRKS